MAIALDVATDGGKSPASGQTHTWTHVCTGSNLTLFVSHTGVAGDDITGATYNSVSMTLVQKKQIPADRWTYQFILDTNECGASASYTGTKQSGQPDSSNTNSGSTITTLTTSTTVVAANCWLILTGGYHSGTQSAGTGTTKRIDAGGGGQGLVIFDSNGTVSTGSQGLVENSGSTTQLSGITCSLAPFVSTVNANFLMFM